ncbi:MAG: PilZ domain-containing protein [Candidatus Gastranaerophilales bacterium]|nr:PilZ domain-containing protein [Candidatus Gastranaerophilales bacterium]
MPDIYDFIKELTKFEIIYKDEKDIPQTARSYIKSLDEGRILIDPPSHKGRVKNISDGTKLKMIICSDKGVFSGESYVIGKELSGMISGIWIGYPTNSKFCQRREYLRVPIKKNIKLTVYQDKNKEKKQELTFSTQDISGKGLSFISDEPLVNYYSIECLLPVENTSANVTCEHIYSKPIIVNGKTKYINALAFIDLGSREMESIIKECFQYQLENRI